MADTTHTLKIDDQPYENEFPILAISVVAFHACRFSSMHKNDHGAATRKTHGKHATGAALGERKQNLTKAIKCLYNPFGTRHPYEGRETARCKKTKQNFEQKTRKYYTSNIVGDHRLPLYARLSKDGGLFPSLFRQAYLHESHNHQAPSRDRPQLTPNQISAKYNFIQQTSEQRLQRGSCHTDCCRQKEGARFAKQQNRKKEWPNTQINTSLPPH